MNDAYFIAESRPSNSNFRINTFKPGQVKQKKLVKID